MRSHLDILKAAGQIAVASACPELSVHTIRSWFQRERIPDEHWQAFAENNLASLEELAAHTAALRKNAA